MSKGTYFIGIYLRLSKEDGDFKEESNSIFNQRTLILNYIYSHKELKEKEILFYIDDGYSGTHFERPAIQRLFTDVKKGKIQCVIVKDLSRFGRNYIDVGTYIEQIFPLLGIRFIAINDYFDSFSDKNVSPDIGIVFQNIINDFYSKDISSKVIATIQRKQENGEYTGGIPPYGYQISKQKEFIKDEIAAATVKEIFYKFAKGQTAASIARELNDRKILPPAEYMKLKYSDKLWGGRNTNVAWNGNMVLNILDNETYMGYAIKSKSKAKEVGSAQRVKKKKRDWIYVADKVEAIVTEEEFRDAKKKRRKRGKSWRDEGA